MEFFLPTNTIETLNNTYPDSEYADKAKSGFPAFSNCDVQRWTSSPDCEIDVCFQIE